MTKDREQYIGKESGTETVAQSLREVAKAVGRYQVVPGEDDTRYLEEAIDAFNRKDFKNTARYLYSVGEIDESFLADLGVTKKAEVTYQSAANAGVIAASRAFAAQVNASSTQKKTLEKISNFFLEKAVKVTSGSTRKKTLAAGGTLLFLAACGGTSTTLPSSTPEINTPTPAITETIGERIANISESLDAAPGLRGGLDFFKAIVAEKKLINGEGDFGVLTITVDGQNYSFFTVDEKAGDVSLMAEWVNDENGIYHYILLDTKETTDDSGNPYLVQIWDKDAQTGEELVPKIRFAFPYSAQEWFLLSQKGGEVQAFFDPEGSLFIGSGLFLVNLNMSLSQVESVTPEAPSTPTPEPTPTEIRVEAMTPKEIYGIRIGDFEILNYLGGDYYEGVPNLENAENILFVDFSHEGEIRIVEAKELDEFSWGVYADKYYQGEPLALGIRDAIFGYIFASGRGGTARDEQVVWGDLSPGTAIFFSDAYLDPNSYSSTEFSTREEILKLTPFYDERFVCKPYTSGGASGILCTRKQD